jgi:hypothetical protein
LAGNRLAKVRSQSASGETSGRPTPKQIEQDLAGLTELGQMLEMCPPGLGGATVCDTLIPTLLRIRNKSGLLVPLQLNESQHQISRTWKKRNIILKARQLGITTYVAARYFIAAITNPGSVVVQVAHDQRSAEEIFRMVHRFQENLPNKSGADKKQAALSFVGSALSITDAIASKDIVDADKFQGGLSKVIDGVVDCLNASSWAKQN